MAPQRKHAGKSTEKPKNTGPDDAEITKRLNAIADEKTNTKINGSHFNDLLWQVESLKHIDEKTATKEGEEVTVSGLLSVPRLAFLEHVYAELQKGKEKFSEKGVSWGNLNHIMAAFVRSQPPLSSPIEDRFRLESFKAAGTDVKNAYIKSYIMQERITLLEKAVIGRQNGAGLNKAHEFSKEMKEPLSYALGFLYLVQLEEHNDRPTKTPKPSDKFKEVELASLLVMFKAVIEDEKHCTIPPNKPGHEDELNKKAQEMLEFIAAREVVSLPAQGMRIQ